MKRMAIDIVRDLDCMPSNSMIRRAVHLDAVEIDGKQVTNPADEVDARDGMEVKIGKRTFNWHEADVAKRQTRQA